MEAGIDKTGAFYKVNMNTNYYCHAIAYYYIELTEMSK